VEESGPQASTPSGSSSSWRLHTFGVQPTRRQASLLQALLLCWDLLRAFQLDRQYREQNHRYTRDISSQPTTAAQRARVSSKVRDLPSGSRTASSTASSSRSAPLFRLRSSQLLANLTQRPLTTKAGMALSLPLPLYQATAASNAE
jgi:hypothetical protein